jgi:hypothetical protein
MRSPGSVRCQAALDLERASMKFQDLYRHRAGIAEPQALAAQLAAGRTLFAAAIMAAPVPLLRVLGADAATAQRVVWLTRMTAVRDGALGVGGLAAARRKDGSVRPWVVAGAVSDAVDAVVIGSAIKQGRVRGFVPSAMVPLAGMAAAAGAVAALGLGRR